jgi:OmpA-OmpF porin, OOP family
LKLTPRAFVPAAFALSLVCIGASAHAQDEAAAPAAAPREFRFEFGLLGGAHFFTDEHGLGRNEADTTEISPDHNVMFGGRLGFHFNRWVSLEAEGVMSPTRTRNEATDLYVFGYRANLLVHLASNPAFRPFVLAGYGGMTSVSNDESVVPNDTDGMFHAGLGFKVGLGERVGLRLEGRILAPGSFAADILPVGSETGFGGPDFEALASLYVNFGVVPQSQYVVKREVMMVPPAPVAPPDPDGDGIASRADKCPDIAEDKDGFEDEDGCPEADNDKDGIPDQADKCPLKPEDKNGIDDDDGCPEEDTDGDGLLGSRDKCPDQPETKNSYKDDDGCPDEIPVEVKKFTGVIEGINFKTNSATILPGSFALLDRAVKVLKDYPEVHLEISGHTDSRGKEDYNRDLSQRRADSVKNYFISQGIATERLISIGYGEDRPIADNATGSGRSKNRRTEFRLINPGEK